MTLKVSDNQYGRPHPSNSWASCYPVLLLPVSVLTER